MGAKPEFKVGDRVVCVATVLGPNIEYGQEFTISRVTRNFVWVRVNGVETGGHYHSRFEPVVEKTNFKVGDRVVCVKGSTFSKEIEVGQEYTIAKVGYDTVDLLTNNGLVTREWYPNRFKLVAPKEVKAEQPKAEPLQEQVGGDHYKKLKIQPIEYCIANNIPFPEGNIIKYVTRWKDKNGVEDLKKARHMLDVLIAGASVS